MTKLTVLILSMMLSLNVYARGHGGGGHRSSGSGSRGGSTHVRSYTTHRGTHVQSHRRTHANNTKNDNWSTKGNANPYTGKAGSKNP